MNIWMNSLSFMNEWINIRMNEFEWMNEWTNDWLYYQISTWKVKLQCNILHTYAAGNNLLVAVWDNWMNV